MGKDAEGDFYVKSSCCLLCGIPEEIAPEIFETGERHCFVKRQPCTGGEVDRTIRAMWSSEVACVRYRGRDSSILTRLARAGMADQADHSPKVGASIRLRDRVTFSLSIESKLTASSRLIAHAFRSDMRADGNRVLPGFLGRRTAWISWYRYQFHPVHFSQQTEVTFLARLKSDYALRGFSWIVDDWLRAKHVARINWHLEGDADSGSPTPM